MRCMLGRFARNIPESFVVGTGEALQCWECVCACVRACLRAFVRACVSE
jgi:hypothetical protein